VSGRRRRRLGAAAGVLLLAAIGASAVGRARAQSATLAAFDEVWQTINDTFYDPSFDGIDWAGVRRELRPRVERAATDAEGRAVIREMLARIGRSHFALLGSPADGDGPRGEATVPITIRPVGDAMLVVAVDAGSPAAAAGLAAGDRLIAIDDRTIADIVAPVDAPDERVRALLSWRRVTNALSGAAGTRAHLRVRAPGGPGSGERGVDVTRAIETGTPVAFGNLPVMRVRFDAQERRTPSGRRVGAIAFNLWMPAVAEPFASAIDRFRSADGLVIDLRGNPGGLADMIRGIAGHIVSEPLVIGRMHTRAAELEFRANPRRSTSDGRRVEPFAGPVAVLVDGLTGSTSECFAGGLQSLGRVRVFGTTTMGQALPASTKTLSNGDVLMSAIGDFVTSTGVRLEGRGVVPDEIVPLEPAALAAGRDAMAAALAWLDRAGQR
jgi:carboxyl-terminal processing protease